MIDVPPVPPSGLTIPEAARLWFVVVVAWYFRKWFRHRKWLARRRK